MMAGRPVSRQVNTDRIPNTRLAVPRPDDFFGADGAGMGGGAFIIQIPAARFVTKFGAHGNHAAIGWPCAQTASGFPGELLEPRA